MTRRLRAGRQSAISRLYPEHAGLGERQHAGHHRTAARFEYLRNVLEFTADQAERAGTCSAAGAVTTRVRSANVRTHCTGGAGRVPSGAYLPTTTNLISGVQCGGLGEFGESPLQFALAKR